MEIFVWTYIRIMGNDDCTRLKERVSSFRHLIGWWAYLKYVRVTYYISTLEGLMWEGEGSVLRPVLRTGVTSREKCPCPETLPSSIQRGRVNSSPLRHPSLALLRISLFDKLVLNSTILKIIWRRNFFTFSFVLMPFGALTSCTTTLRLQPADLPFFIHTAAGPAACL